MKKRRQQRILEIIATCSIQTQDELASALRGEGFEVTQATVSRDIKELRLVKILGDDGHYCYGRSDGARPDGRKSYNILSDSILTAESAVNIVVVKCASGRANAVCATIDGMERSKIVGTIAGDDTIFIVLRNADDASMLCAEISGFIGK